MLLASMGTFLKSTKVISQIDWSECGEMPDGGEEPSSEDNRELEDDEIFKVSFSYNFSSPSSSKEENFSSFLFFGNSHFSEIDSPPPQS